MSHHLTAAMSRSREDDLARAAERRRLRTERDDLRPAPALPSSLWARLTGRRTAPIAATAAATPAAPAIAPSPAAMVADALAVPAGAIIEAAQDAVTATVEVAAPETAEHASA